MKTLIAILAATASTAVAQDAFTTRLTADVPFAFHQGNNAMSAGRYSLKPGPAPRTMIFAYSTGENLSQAIFSYDNAEPRNTGYLRFHCYEGGKCFLREAALPGSMHKMVLPRGRIEAEYRRGSETRVTVVDTPLRATGVFAE
jgi:hypothetical protein